MKPSTAQKTTLPNGVRILTKSMPFVRSVSMGVWVNVGGRDESASENGLSHLIEHMIFKGTRKRTAFQIAKEFDAIGGHTNAFTSFENTCYHARVMDAHLETMVDILTDIFLNSEFAEEEVAKERPVIFQEIGMVEDNPEEYIHVLAGSAYWGDNPLGRSILGTRENIPVFTSAKIKAFFNRFYQPSQIVVAVAGNVSHERIVALVGPAFSVIKSGPGFPGRETPVGYPQIKLHQRKLEQVHICLGTRGVSITDPKRYAFSLLNTIFGGNMSSRLFQKIREHHGLAYAVYSFISSYEDTGMFGVYAGVRPDKVRETLGLIMEEVRTLRKHPVEAAELNDAKNYTKGNLLLASESVDNQMVRLAQNEINFGRSVPLQEIIDQIEAVTGTDIADLAAELFQKDRLALTALGPLNGNASFEELLLS
ncbi:MAG: pitrilysin family protein [Desulfobacterales bacterium]|jgi:predicted Zn-dependent peptidase